MASSAVCSVSARSQQESELLIQGWDTETKRWWETLGGKLLNRTIKHSEVIDNHLYWIYRVKLAPYDHAIYTRLSHNADSAAIKVIDEEMSLPSLWILWHKFYYTSLPIFIIHLFRNVSQRMLFVEWPEKSCLIHQLNQPSDWKESVKVNKKLPTEKIMTFNPKCYNFYSLHHWNLIFVIILTFKKVLFVMKEHVF